MANLLLELGVALASSVVRGFAGALLVIASIESLKALRGAVGNRVRKEIRWQRQE